MLSSFLDAVIRNCTSFPITYNDHPGHLSNVFDLSSIAWRVKLHFLLKYFPTPNFSIDCKVQVKILNYTASKKTKLLC